MNTPEPKERGAAKVNIELKNGTITVTHGTDDVVLEKWVADEGDWKRLWRTITELSISSKRGGH